jgi:formiminoglutamase
VTHAWTGRVDAQDGAAGLRWHQVMKLGPAKNEGALNLLGFACDEGVRRNQGRVGAKEGPTALRTALSNLAIHRPLLLHDLGDVACTSGDLESAQEKYAKAAAAALKQSQFVVGLGGGHEIAYASFLGLHNSAVKGRVGIINVDAHLDLRNDAQRTSGTGFLDALKLNPAARYLACGISPASNTEALYQTARSHGVVIVEDDRDNAAEPIAQFLNTVDHLYLSLDLDVFPAADAPGVSAPAGLGVNPQVVSKWLRFIAQSGKLRIFDVAELNPSLDQDQRTARLAARMIYEVVNHLP